MTTTTPKRRINIYLEEDLLATLDAYARVAQVTRTELLHQLLYPAKPALDRLLQKADAYFRMSDEQKLETRRQLDRLEKGLSSVIDQVNTKLDRMACTCTVTEHERQEDALCPVHGTAAP